ncbi:Phosphoribulokinase/uridine kinase [Penicillium chermesinum]|uniref:Phosphoribulokinase/uridine kinase n=1 Tax=Penicillium chermesinum TaxID=63820 RepID=A0A9W9P6J1_9EURO|nr:Phosphoribulokinase/uridine kinase [Penicillium chermesinum]KAJ5238575.1 Phosphoribulokinase/uridine kinase [Penicillium chermesinum]
MDEQIKHLVNKTWVASLIQTPSRIQSSAYPSNCSQSTAKFCCTADDARLMIAVSGIPGSGKTELAQSISKRINQIYASESPSAPPISTALPMDGFHLTRAQLAAMPDPEHAFARRGAEFTFDGEKFLGLVKKLQEPITAETKDVHAPSFDHAVKDPVEDDITIPATCRVVLFEGNYLSLDKEPWRETAKLMDELWFVDVDFEVARKRLIRRHIKAGIAKNEEEGNKRAKENDLVNGQEIVDFRLPVQEIVKSVYDPSWEEP